MQTDTNTPAGFDYIWRVKSRLPERFGQPVKVIIRPRTGGMNSVLVEFRDGMRVNTSRNHLRKGKA